MAAVIDVDLEIDRISRSVGSVCSINYTYTLVCDEMEVRNGLSFTVSCEVWGKGVFVARVLADSVYDTHTVPASLRSMHARSFIVPCAELDEEFGKDEIYVQVYATSTLGATFFGVSDLVKDHF